jgi:RNA polymerase sigma-70 factor (ECF subfamily)
MTGDTECGKDLAQETFARVFARRKDYQPNGKFSTWLWRIALNLSYDELRRRRRRDEWPLDAPDAVSALELCAAPELAPDHSLLRHERGELVRRALERLPEGQRTVLVLRHYENLKFREIAELLDLPEGTVKSRMADALTRMTQLLKASIQEQPEHALKTQHETKENYL